MKDVPHIFETWDRGEFFGSDRRAHGRVTVEPGWSLQLLDSLSGSLDGEVDPGRTGPWRYYQSVDGPLTPTMEVPNIKSIDIDRSIDTDAASCTITIYNQWMDDNDVPETLVNQLGNPGYFTYNRGDSADAQARWNHQQNEWNNILVPNALLRTYQGYGGYDSDNNPLPLQECIDSGYLTITGTWLVDEVTLNTDGLLTLKCRDAAKLLIEQMITPPLIPASIGTLKYYRYLDTAADSIWNPGSNLPPREVESVPIRYSASQTDGILTGGASFSGDLPIDGIHPSWSVDGNPNTHSVGYGWDSPSAPYAVDWWEYEVNAMMDRVYVHAWGGPFTMYISVMEYGVWVGTEIVPGPEPDIGLAKAPYVLRSGINQDEGKWFVLPKVYNAQRIRISFRDLKDQMGYPAPRQYRSGIREVQVGNGGAGYDPYKIAFSIASHPGNGYWIVDNSGATYYFGESRQLTENTTVGYSRSVQSAQGHPTQVGYWTLEENGRIHAYGAAQNFHGIAETATLNNDYVDMCVTHTGNGYILARRNGQLFAYGDAVTSLGAASVTVPSPHSPIYGVAHHPSGYGMWAVNALGQVYTYGAATYHGGVDDAERPTVGGTATSIEASASGNGYWILWATGQVFAYGDAPHHGNGTHTAGGFELVWWELTRSNESGGYWMLRGNGTVGAYNATPFGGLDAPAIIREDGNYMDYSTIIKDLAMWSGFTLAGNGTIGLHGNIETTGAFSEHPIEEDVFDKKSVIDAMTTIKEIVGYLLWVDEEGALHFESPNWWGPGNYFEGGERTSFIPEIDESIQLTAYSSSFNDDQLRSEIIITNYLTENDNTGTVTTRHVPPGQNFLRGMVRPAIWSNEVFSSPAEQQIMAELISLHIWFSQRTGSVTCAANPCIQVNDQVRIYERITGETYIHYVRGVTTSMDLDTGVYTMQLTTHWLGSETSWVIQSGLPNPTQNDVFYTTQPVIGQ